MTSLKLAKQVLRKEVKARVAALTDEEKCRQSSVVTNMLFETPQWKSSERVSIFLSMKDEVQTQTILETALREGKKCFIPCYVGSGMDMLRLQSLQDYESLPVTAWNIKQPAEHDTSREEAVSGGGLDVVLMPGLAFSPGGGRLGRGKGYYDSYLTSYKQRLGRAAFTIAIAFNEQIYDTIPVTEHDVTIDMILYENRNKSQRLCNDCV